jgi:nucleotide-binding universal stress UspA family protein
MQVEAGAVGRSGNGTATTIVCGVDGGEATRVILDTARWLAAAFGAQLVVAHAFDEAVLDAEQIMDDVRLRTAPDRHVETRLVEGSPAERLLGIADEEGAAFIVAGSRGRGAMASGVLGSVSRTLVRRANCPVVVVPPNSGDPNQVDDSDASIVCGVDGSDHALAAVRVARALAERLGYRVAVVHAPRSAKSLTYVGRSTTPSLSQQPDQVARQSREIVQAAVDLLGDRPSSAHIEPGQPAEVLELVAKDEHGRLIVIAGRGMGTVQASLLGSVAMALVSSAEIPVVVLPEGAERDV